MNRLTFEKSLGGRNQCDAYCIALALWVALSLLAPSAWCFEEAQSRLEQNRTKSVIEKLRLTTCWIKLKDSSGTGWVIDRERRLVITNFHVTQGREELEVYFPVQRNGEWVNDVRYYRDQQKPIKATLLDEFPISDLALLRLDSLPEKVRALEVAAKSVEPGSVLHTMGAYTNGSSSLWTYTQGVARNVGRGNTALGTETWILEAQMPFNQGNSGGPILDDDGRLVAVVEGYRTFGANGSAVREVSIGIDIRALNTWYSGAQKLSDPNCAYSLYRKGLKVLKTRGSREAISLFDAAIAKETDKVAISEYTLVRSKVCDHLQTEARVQFSGLRKRIGQQLVAEYGGERLNQLIATAEKATDTLASADAYIAAHALLKQDELPLRRRAIDALSAAGKSAEALEQFLTLASLNPNDEATPRQFQQLAAASAEYLRDGMIAVFPTISSKTDESAVWLLLARIHHRQGDTKRCEAAVKSGLAAVVGRNSAGNRQKLSPLLTWWTVDELLRLGMPRSADQFIREHFDEVSARRTRELKSSLHENVLLVGILGGLARKTGNKELEAHSTRLFDWLISPFDRSVPASVQASRNAHSLLKPHFESIRLMAAGKPKDALAATSASRLRETWYIYGLACLLDDDAYRLRETARHKWEELKQSMHQKTDAELYGISTTELRSLVDFYGNGKAIDCSRNGVDKIFEIVEREDERDNRWWRSLEESYRGYTFRKKNAPFVVRSSNGVTRVGTQLPFYLETINASGRANPDKLFELYKSTLNCSQPALKSLLSLALYDAATRRAQTKSHSIPK